jgi:hypothetical protein
MTKTFARTLVALIALAIGTAGTAGMAAGTDPAITGTVLAVSGGYVFLTGGDVYREADDVRIVDVATGLAATSAPATGSFVELRFDAALHVEQIAIAAKPLPPERSPDLIRSASVLPAFVPSHAPVVAGTLVPVTFTVRVPASTQAGDTIYLTSGERGWDPLSTRMDRVDAFHFRATISVPVGARFRYLYTRGNSPTIERGANGLQRKPRVLQLEAVAPHDVDDTVEHWGDEVGNGVLPAPQATPTPYNPAPYPNLPIAVPAGGR